MLGCLLIKIQQLESKIVGIWKTTGNVRKEYLMRSWLFFLPVYTTALIFLCSAKKVSQFEMHFSLARCFFLWFLFLCLKGGLFLCYFVDIKWQKLDHKRQIMYWKRRCKVHKVFGSEMQSNVIGSFADQHRIKVRFCSQK